MTRKEARREVVKAIKRYPKRNVPGSRDAGTFHALVSNLGNLVGKSEFGDRAFLTPRKKSS